MGRRAAICLLGAGVALASVSAAPLLPRHAPAEVAAARQRSPARHLAHPDEACARCHADIYQHYERTSMALGSGLAQNGALSGEFRHAASGVSYRVFMKDDALWMSYARSSSPQQGDRLPALHGERRLQYSIG